MAEIPATDGDPQVTDPNGPATPDPAPAATTASGDDDTVTIKKSDYAELQSQRDRANEALKKTAGGEELLNEIAAERGVGAFLKEHKDKYPDLEVEDLLAYGPDEIEAAATRLQRRIEDSTQKRLAEVERPSTPRLTENEKTAQLQGLKKQPGGESFQKMLDVKSS